MREVFITDTAKADIEYIASFLQETYSNKVKVDFLVKLSEKLIFIEKMPFMYAPSVKNLQVRKCVIHKNAACFYEVSEKQIYILSVIDTRINPENSKF